MRPVLAIPAVNAVTIIACGRHQKHVLFLTETRSIFVQASYRVSCWARYWLHVEHSLASILVRP